MLYHCKKIIQDFEGFRSYAYKDSGGKWTIGYGFTYYEDGTNVKQNDTMNRNEADRLLDFYINRYRYDVINLLKVAVNDNQLTALTSFCYNLGKGNLASSTLLKEVNLNPKHYDTIANEFYRWKYVNGKIENGLLRRRREEAKIYCTPI